jgi:hypothetical protein
LAGFNAFWCTVFGFQLCNCQRYSAIESWLSIVEVFFRTSAFILTWFFPCIFTFSKPGNLLRAESCLSPDPKAWGLVFVFVFIFKINNVIWNHLVLNLNRSWATTQNPSHELLRPFAAFVKADAKFFALKCQERNLQLLWAL